MSENINNQNASLLRRAFWFLEDGEWGKADEYAERVLDIELENSDAYLCKLLSELHIARKELLSDVSLDISKNKNYIKALKYADASQRNFLENCAQKAHARVVEQLNQETINTFSDIIETYRNTQQSNRNMIKRGKSAVRMYLITYLVLILYVAVMITVNSLNLAGVYGPTVLGMGLGIGVPVLVIILWVGHARLVRFWDIDYGDERGWVFPMFFGMINVYFTLGIMGLVKSVKTRKECKALINNNVEMGKQIRDLQRKIEEQKH